MKVICDCGNEFWMPELNSREVDSKEFIEYLKFKVSNVQHTEIPKLEVRYVICKCGRKCFVVSDPVEAHADNEFSYDEIRRRGIGDRAEMTYPECYSVNLLDEALDHVKEEDLILAAKKFNKLAKDLIEGAPFPPSDVFTRTSAFATVAAPTIEYGRDPGDETPG